MKRVFGIFLACSFWHFSLANTLEAGPAFTGEFKVLAIAKNSSGGCILDLNLIRTVHVNPFEKDAIEAKRNYKVVGKKEACDLQQGYIANVSIAVGRFNRKNIINEGNWRVLSVNKIISTSSK